ncbi:M20/M25/M40 family metallo-hydrolase [Sphingomonas sp. NSE70-1]|uniref:M20/M25/M40 family metallo-hydrolase n=1 Tax=Sphingomonas caseinilyticus TaxID=2908205 RepID=A0ABT0RW25_9SPHN|nr:M20/M25/M40 family metallo-hydrolase [Sphingomonas caseinilyticus]MCL6699187.1 M20/M25/M40 family metallo-hydrolase [Sphingomonas caseinilyticus]
MQTRLIAALTGLSLALAPTPAAAKLSPAETRMIRTVDTEQERTLVMLEKWVNQNSGSLNVEGVTKVGEMLRSELEPLGFKVQWIDMTQTGRAGHIVATHKGNGKGKRLLLIGHLDTVFEPDSPFQRWERRGNDGIGPGSGDDKGGMAVMIAALRAMQQAGTLKDADIEVVLTGDEEDNGQPIELARRDLVAAGKRADVALDFEGLADEDGKDIGSIARRSSGAWTLTVTARSGHSSGIFSPGSGNGAVYELARIIDAFRTKLPEDKLTFNVGLVGGGATAKLDEDRIRLEATGKTNIIPETAVARGDLRAISREQIERVKAKMQAIVADGRLNGATAKLEFDPDEYPPMAPTEGNRAILAKLNVVNADMGLEQMGELDPMKRGAGDISFVAQDVDGLIGLGAASNGDHAPGERVDIASIWRQAKRAAILMTRLSREKR